MKATEETAIARLTAQLKELTEELRLVRKAMVENIGITRRLVGEKQVLVDALARTVVRAEERVQQARAPTLTAQVPRRQMYNARSPFDPYGECVNCGKERHLHTWESGYLHPVCPS